MEQLNLYVLGSKWRSGSALQAKQQQQHYFKTAATIVSTPKP
jgi:quinol monooxygenase YgiN